MRKGSCHSDFKFLVVRPGNRTGGGEAGFGENSEVDVSGGSHAGVEVTKGHTAWEQEVICGLISASQFPERSGPEGQI